MFRVDTSTAAENLPAPGAAGTPGYFQSGDPQAGTPATIPGADWFNIVQEELAYLVTSAGLALDKTDRTQLRAAVAAMIAGASKSIIISDATFEASVADGEVVRWDSGNNRFDEALADGSANGQAVGIADVTNAEVVCFGETRASLVGGLTPGSRYYLDGVTPGALAVAAADDPREIGIAKAADVLFVDIDPALTGLAKLAMAQTFTAAQRATITPVASAAGSIAITLADSNDFSHTLSENTVLANPPDIATAVGQKGNIHFTQPAAGSGPFTVGAGTYWKIIGAVTEENDALDTLAYEVVAADQIRAAWINKFGG